MKQLTTKADLENIKAQLFPPNKFLFEGWYLKKLGELWERLEYTIEVAEGRKDTSCPTCGTTELLCGYCVISDEGCVSEKTGASDNLKNCIGVLEDLLGDVELVSYGLAPNPNGFCYEIIGSAKPSEIKELDDALERLTSEEEDTIREMYL